MSDEQTTALITALRDLLEVAHCSRANLDAMRAVKAICLASAASVDMTDVPLEVFDQLGPEFRVLAVQLVVTQIGLAINGRIK